MEMGPRSRLFVLSCKISMHLSCTPTTRCVKERATHSRRRYTQLLSPPRAEAETVLDDNNIMMFENTVTAQFTHPQA